jgi:hypothetical protein
MDTLDDLGAQLRALSSGQPAQPGDRVPGVTRRAGRIRRTRAAVAVAAAVAVLAPAGLLLTSARHDAGPQFAHSDVLTWPDRSYAADRSVAEGAVAYWTGTYDDAGGLRLTDRLRWLFRGTVPMPDHADEYVAVFVADRGADRVLVMSHVLRSAVDAHGEGSDPAAVPMTTPWVQQEVPLARGLDHVGLYLWHQGRTSGSGSSANTNVLLLLASPDARGVRLTSEHLPAGPAGPVQSSARSSNGVFVSQPMTLDGLVQATVLDARGRGRQTYAFGTGRAYPLLVDPPAPDLPPNWQMVGAGSGQSAQQEDGSWTGSSFNDLNSNQHKPLTLLARCYGGGTVTYALSPFTEGAPARPAAARGSVACDGATHQAFPAVRITTPGWFLEEKPDRLQAITYQLGWVG